jgi:hypothetical protein
MVLTGLSEGHPIRAYSLPKRLPFRGSEISMRYLAHLAPTSQCLT